MPKDLSWGMCKFFLSFPLSSPLSLTDDTVTYISRISDQLVGGQDYPHFLRQIAGPINRFFRHVGDTVRTGDTTQLKSEFYQVGHAGE